jgi:hypothetical protein
MASGHEYRTRRPNTWLLRPTPQVKILLANPEPSTHGPKPKNAPAIAVSAGRSKAEMIFVSIGPSSDGGVRKSSGSSFSELLKDSKPQGKRFP